MDKLNFGAIERKYIDTVHDYNLAAATAVLDVIPTVFMPDYSAIPVDMQGKTPTCGGHGGTFLKDGQEFIETGVAPHFTPRFTWINIKKRDGYPINLDTGTDSLGVMKALANEGVCDFDLLGNDVSLPFDQYSSPSAITQDMLDNAQPRIIGNYAFQKYPSFYDLKKAIYQNKFVLTTLRLGEEFWTPSWQEKDILPLRVPKQVVSAHFVVAYAYDEKYVYFRNSWSKDWGRNGNGYFGIEYTPYVTEIATAVDLSNETVKKMVMKRNILQQLLILWKQLLGK